MAWQTAVARAGPCADCACPGDLRTRCAPEHLVHGDRRWTGSAGSRSPVCSSSGRRPSDSPSTAGMLERLVGSVERLVRPPKPDSVRCSGLHSRGSGSLEADAVLVVIPVRRPRCSSWCPDSSWTLCSPGRASHQPARRLGARGSCASPFGWSGRTSASVFLPHLPATGDRARGGRADRRRLVPHEEIWLVFLTNFILGDLFGTALGLIEVTLAERLVPGRGRTRARGAVGSSDVELLDPPGPPGPPGSEPDQGPRPGPSSDPTGSGKWRQRKKKKREKKKKKKGGRMGGTRRGRTGGRRSRWKRRSTARPCRCSSCRSRPVSRSCRRPGSSVGCRTPSRGHQHRRRDGQGTHGSRQESSVGCLHHDDHLGPGRPRIHRLRVQGPRPHPADRRGTGERIHGPSPRLHGGDAGDRAVHGVPAVVPGRDLRWRGAHPPEDRRHRPGLHRPLGRGGGLRPHAGQTMRVIQATPGSSRPGSLAVQKVQDWPTATWVPTATTSPC